MTKFVIIVLMIAMVVSLGIGLYHLLKSPDERDSGDKVVKALTWRIGIWIVLFGFIFLSIKMGWITPSNSVNPAKFNEEQQQRIDDSNGRYEQPEN
ncbi:hypothetical protein NBRC116583_30060 [Arenicella sp. 4NH20-0111]|uniref:twin transmembrane helix small protein n=1 Tax=Arenicella sp. 4NH20-0111 TaxID=3127648 RepID=UPI0031036B54